MNPGLKTPGRPLSRLLIASAIAAAFPAHADDKADIDKLKAQIQELDQKLRILDRKQEIATEEASAKQKSAPVVNTSDKGFGIKSADGQFEYKGSTEEEATMVAQGEVIGLLQEKLCGA